MFKMKYKIESKYLPSPSSRRSGIKMNRVGFCVLHDTGNRNSTSYGNVNYYINSCNTMEASAHLFVDDKHIVECIPSGLLSNGLSPEKAWHVVYNGTQDNQIFGDDANDIAIGIELCFGSNINADEAYARYIWIAAFICYFYQLDPKSSLIGHHLIQPGKIDPVNGLSYSGRTYEQLLQDIVKEYIACTQEEEDDEMNKVLEYDEWAWEELDQFVGHAYNDNIITDWKWVEQARNKSMVYKDLLLLKIVIDERRRKF
jgi:N-acetylmuramoyl-L-alanine amidase